MWKDIAEQYPDANHYAELRDLITGECLLRGDFWYRVEEGMIFVMQNEHYDGFEGWGPYHTDVYNRNMTLLFSQEYDFKEMNDRWLLWGETDTTDFVPDYYSCAMTDLQGDIILDDCINIQLDQDGYAVYRKVIRNPITQCLAALGWDLDRIEEVMVSKLGMEGRVVENLLRWLKDEYICGIVEPNGTCTNVEGRYIFPSHGSGCFLVHTLETDVTDDAPYRFVNERGETLFSRAFVDAYEFFDDSAIVSDDGEEYYMIDLDGNRLGEAVWPMDRNYYGFDDPNATILYVPIDGQIRLVNRVGEFTTDETFSESWFMSIRMDQREKLLCLRDIEGNVCLVGDDGKVFTRLKDMDDPVMDDVIDGVAAIGDTGAMGLMRVSGDRRGEWILEPEYYSIFGSGSDHFIMEDESYARYYLDSQGNILAPDYSFLRYLERENLNKSISNQS